jgi:hypothetical protein
MSTIGYWKEQGPYAPPAIAASTTPVNNPARSCCLVQVQGGTVTVVAVNGVTVGAGDGLYLVPPGGTIALTYSVAPTWLWYQLP